MRTTIVAAGLTLALGLGTAVAQTAQPGQTGQAQPGAQRLSQAQCQALWSRVNPSGAANVAQAQMTSYTNSFSQADSNSDGQLSQTEFMSACERGLIQDTATTGAGGGTTGTGAGQSGNKK